MIRIIKDRMMVAAILLGIPKALRSDLKTLSPNSCRFVFIRGSKLFGCGSAALGSFVVEIARETSEEYNSTASF